MIVIVFIGIATLLLLEGAILHRLITRSDDERIAGFIFGYPLGVFINTFVFFTLHLLHIPFGIASIFGAHAMLVVLFAVLLRQKKLALFHHFPWTHSALGSLVPRNAVERALFYIVIFFLFLIFLQSAVTAMTFPMFYWDSFAHWSLRAKVSLDAGSFVIDGVIQPQYPVLLHSLQMLFSISGFRDQVVNGASFLLSFTLFSSIFYSICRSRDAFCAVLVLILLTGVPLVSIHLRQGMGDIHIVAYVLLSALLLDQALSTQSKFSLILSALFVAAAAWTKYEGLYFGVLPWCIIVSLVSLQNHSLKPNIYCGLLPAVLLTIPWPLLTLLRGLNLSAHGGSVAFHLEAVPLMLQQLFTLGTFGIHWWVISFILMLLLWFERKRLIPFLIERPTLLWGIFSFVLLFCVYTATNEVRGLVHRDNFSRAMFLPTLLFTQALVMECYYRFYSPQPSFSRSVS